MSNDDDEDAMTQAARQLQRDISPERDLWPAISSAITASADAERETPGTQRRRRSPMFAQAAAVLLLVGGSSALTYLAMKDQTGTITIAPPEMVFDQVSFGNSHDLGPGFQDARQGLAAELEVELQKLPDESRANIKTNLNLIHDAIVDINQALEDEPGNTLLQEQLLRAYREELTLLQRVSGLSRNVMRRNDI